MPKQQISFKLAWLSSLWGELRKRWIIFALIGVYLITGGIASLLIYHFRWDQAATRWAARIYPLPAAVVNHDIIWLSTYYQRGDIISFYATRTNQANTVPNDPTVRDRETLDQLIDYTLLREQARKVGITVTQKELSDAYIKLADDTKQNQKLDSSVDAQANFKKVLQNFYGLTPQQFMQEILLAKVYEDKIRSQLFTQVHLQTIVVNDQQQANDLIGRLNKGEDFATLAKNYSIDLSSRDQGGDFGWIERGQLNNQDLENAAFSLKTGQITQTPIKTDFGWHILKVVDRKDGPISNQSYDQWFATVKNQAKVHRFVGQ